MLALCGWKRPCYRQRRVPKLPFGFLLKLCISLLLALLARSLLYHFAGSLRRLLLTLSFREVQQRLRCHLSSWLHSVPQRYHH